MTDFTTINLSVASTRAGAFHSVGFDVSREDWPGIRAKLERLDARKTLKFREETKPRNEGVGGDYMWVWVVMTNETSVSILLELGKFADGPVPEIKLKRYEYP